MTIDTKAIESLKRVADEAANFKIDRMARLSAQERELIDYSVPALLSALKEKDAENARLREQVRRYAERLEITHVFVLSGGELVRKEVSPEDWDKQIDGIACRDETIKLLESDHMGRKS